MNQFTVWIFFAVLSITTNFCIGIADINRPPKHCIMERAHRMIGYNCAKLDLRDIPTYLKSSTEVSNLSCCNSIELENALKSDAKLLRCSQTQ